MYQQGPMRQEFQSPGMIAYGLPPHMIGYGPSPHMIGYGPNPNIIGYGPSPHMIGYGPNPNIINYGPPPNMTGYWQPAEMVVRVSQPGMYYEQPVQQLQQRPQQELSEFEPPIEVIEYQQKAQIPDSESSAQNTSREGQDSNLLLQTGNFLLDPNHMPRNVSESADASGISESNLKQNIYPVLNSEKDILDDNEPDVRKCIDKNTTFSDIFDESDDTVESSDKSNQEIELSPEEITSDVYEEYKIRPLLRDFSQLERYSLVSEVIYEEEEPESGEDGSKSDGSIHSDTIIDYEKCDVNIGGTDLLNQCHIENNESIIAEEKYVANISELVEKSQPLTSLDDKPCTSNLSINETPKVSDEFHRSNTFSNGFEEEGNRNEVNKEILQSNFDTIKDLQLDKNYAGGAIEVDKVMDVDYSSLPEEELSAKSKKEEETNCASLFLYYFRRLSSLLFSCTKSKK
ncbi:uncharacterized protein [Centruroides vittatus]|uniref:uncharacterized protein n=1 Tax=Centruroides vittatus TaxID=120091 RepID=UPI00350ED353